MVQLRAKLLRSLCEKAAFSCLLLLRGESFNLPPACFLLRLKREGQSPTAQAKS
jgi:hypothetical protein